MDYEKAYKRQKAAREEAERILESKARELYDINESLLDAYNQLKTQKHQMLHQEKLASIGQLAAGVAHEINNPLGFVKSNMNTLSAYTEKMIRMLEFYQSQFTQIKDSSPELLQDVIAAEEALSAELDLDFTKSDTVNLLYETVRGIHRIESIVKGLKTFSRKDITEEQAFDFNECIHSTLKLLHNEIKYKCNVEFELGDLPMAMGNPGEVSQVIVNLVMNSVHSIKSNGLINIRSRWEDGFHIFEISDNGCGIKADIINQIFDPFFTTKSVDKGTGLGLSITHGIVTGLGGEIDVESTEGEGTRFTVKLKLSEIEATA